MRKNIKNKAIALTLATVAGVFALCGCGGKAEEPSRLLPDYSAYDLQYEVMCDGPSNGRLKHDNVWYQVAPDGQTEEGFKTCLDMGNNTLFLTIYQDTLGDTEKWETSHTKEVAEKAVAAGFKRIYFRDQYLNKFNYLGLENKKLVDPQGGKFKTTDELDEYVTERLKEYVNVPYIAGVDIGDEPTYKQTEAMAAMGASIKRCAVKLGRTDFKVFVNLYSYRMDPTLSGFFGEPGTYQSASEVYRRYIEDFVKGMDADMMCVDDYPYAPEEFVRGYFTSLQTLRSVCSDYDIDMAFYVTAFSEFKSDRFKFFRGNIGQAELYHNLNSLVGFGVRKLKWFSYGTYPIGYDNGNVWYDYSTLVDRYNNPTDLYYYAKQYLAELQSFANVILNYEYQGAKFYTCEGMAQFDNTPYLFNYTDSSTGTTLEFDNSYEFKKVKNVGIDNDVALLTELYDEENDLRMYMVMNPIDPYFSRFGRTDEKIKVDFGVGTEWVAEFDRGKLSYVKLENGVYTKTLSAGYATYVIPL